jgi:hypothetical protein
MMVPVVALNRLEAVVCAEDEALADKLVLEETPSSGGRFNFATEESSLRGDERDRTDAIVLHFCK